MFKITENKGFHLTFRNGVTVSVQFGRGNYCGNRYEGGWTGAEPCENAEVMVWAKDGTTLGIPDEQGEIPESPDVAGYQSAHDVARIIAYFAAYKG